MHPCIDVATVKYVHDIPKIICNRNIAKQALWKHPICLTDYDHDYILEEIEHREKIELEINSRDDGDEEYIFCFNPFFISSIELLYMVFPQYVYACDISYYFIMSFILQPLFLLINMLLTSQKYLFSLCCWCIWLRETLIQTWETFLILPKGSI